MPLPILALALATFAIGTTEFVIMGILPDVARDLAVTIPAAGLLVSGYALGVAAGAPLLAVLTSRMPRKRALLLLMAIFIAGNILCAVAPGYASLMIARVLTSFAHGAFFGIGAVVAATLVPESQRASAIALMFTGLALANVLGVPLGTFIGQALGWRATFWTVTATGVAAAVALIALVPECPGGGALDLRGELGVLKKPQVWLALSMTVFGFGGVFVVFTYIALILVQASGYAPSAVTWLLVLFGLGLSIGNGVGGKLADRGGLRALFGVFVALAVVMCVFTVTMHSRVGAAVTLFVWGVAAFATVPGLQTRVLHQAGGAPNLASTLNIGAFNVGNAFGAWLGGRVLAAGHPVDALPPAAALVTAIAVGLSAIALWLDARAARLARSGAAAGTSAGQAIHTNSHPGDGTLSQGGP